jgi:hypothetical protein
MAALFMFIVYVYIYVCLHYFVTNVFNPFVWKDSSGFSSPIFPIINSHVFSHNNKKSVLYYCAFRLLRFVILSTRMTTLENQHAQVRTAHTGRDCQAIALASQRATEVRLFGCDHRILPTLAHFYPHKFSFLDP